MASLFTKIIKGEIPCHKLAEDDRFISFLDINPLNPGHALVVPKVEIDYIFDQDNDTLSGLIIFAKKIAKAIKQAVPCVRVGMMVAGLEVPHTHIHLVPINKVSDLNFLNAKKAGQDDLAKIAAAIRTYL